LKNARSYILSFSRRRKRVRNPTEIRNFGVRIGRNRADSSENRTLVPKFDRASAHIANYLLSTKKHAGVDNSQKLLQKTNKIIGRAIHNHYAIYYAKSLAIITIFEVLESYARSLAIITVFTKLCRVHYNSDAI